MDTIEVTNVHDQASLFCVFLPLYDLKQNFVLNRDALKFLLKQNFYLAENLIFQTINKLIKIT